jgi:hypothetical protein
MTENDLFVSYYISNEALLLRKLHFEGQESIEVLGMEVLLKISRPNELEI